MSTAEDSSLCLCLSLYRPFPLNSPCHGPRPVSSRRRPRRSRRCRCHNWPLDEYVYPLSSPLFVPDSPSKSVFAKCKESLQDGPRLEYISWRLWYRELEARRTNKPFPIPPHSPHLIPASCPLTPVSEHGVEHPGKFLFPLPPSRFLTSSRFCPNTLCFLLPHLQARAPHPQNLVKLNLNLIRSSALPIFPLHFLPTTPPPAPQHVALSPPDQNRIYPWARSYAI